MAYDPEADLRVLEAMAANLTPYLYENELYGMLAQNLPRLTVGGLLLRLYRLRALEEKLDGSQQQRFRDSRINFEQLRSEWMVHYENKIVQELKARLNSLSNFLSDYAADPTAARGGYPNEATQRTIVHHLQVEAMALDMWDEEDFEKRLTPLDRRLQAALKNSEKKFIWDEELAEVYPQETFWWLYGVPTD
jgi:hypothetical protein